MARTGDSRPSRNRGSGLRLQSRVNNSLRRRGPKRDYSAVNPVVKYFLFFFNVASMALGAGAAYIGIRVLYEKDKNCFECFVCFCFDLSCWFACLGVVVFVVSFFGVIGALREILAFLKIYHIICSIILLSEIVVVIFICIFYFDENTLADIGLYPEKYLKDTIVRYRDEPDMQNFIDNLQEDLECCGASNDVEGYKDWNNNVYFNCTPENISPERCYVPYSCCRHSDGDNINYQCGAGMLRDDTTASARAAKIFTDGCLKGALSRLDENIWLVCGVIFLSFVAQIILIFFARALISQIREQMAKWR